MLGLCFLFLPRKVPGDGRKNSHERKITERDGGRRRGRETETERERSLSLVINERAIVCFCFFVHKDGGRGDKASDAYEQCLGSLFHTRDLELCKSRNCTMLNTCEGYRWRSWHVGRPQNDHLKPLIPIMSSSSTRLSVYSLSEVT